MNREPSGLSEFERVGEQFAYSRGLHYDVDLPEDQRAHLFVGASPGDPKGLWPSVDIYVSSPPLVEDRPETCGRFVISVFLVRAEWAMNVSGRQKYPTPLPFPLAQLEPTLGLWVVSNASEDARLHDEQNLGRIETYRRPGLRPTVAEIQPLLALMSPDEQDRAT